MSGLRKRTLGYTITSRLCSTKHMIPQWGEVGCVVIVKTCVSPNRKFKIQIPWDHMLFLDQKWAIEKSTKLFEVQAESNLQNIEGWYRKLRSIDTCVRLQINMFKLKLIQKKDALVSNILKRKLFNSITLLSSLFLWNSRLNSYSHLCMTFCRVDIHNVSTPIYKIISLHTSKLYHKTLSNTEK